jgi:hypothetical protein
MRRIHNETKPVFLAKTERKQLENLLAADLPHKSYKSDLLGDYQNTIKTVLLGNKILKSETPFKIDEKSILNGLQSRSKYWTQNGSN